MHICFLYSTISNHECISTLVFIVFFYTVATKALLLFVAFEAMSNASSLSQDQQAHTLYIVTPLSRLPDLVRNRIPDLNVHSYLLPGDFRIDPSEFPKIAQLIHESKADILITFHRVLRNLVQSGLSCEHLRWFQSCGAGVDEILQAFKKPPDHMVFTRMGEGFGVFMAEYVLGQIISREHYFPQMADYQRQKVWNRSKFIKKRSLSTLTIGILGTGAIGSKIAVATKALGMTVWGLSRTKKQKPNFDVLLQNKDLGQFLAGCDYVCSALPSTTETKGMLSGDVLKACQDKRSVFINVGRGDIIDEASIMQALNNNWIGGAILDTTYKEPLPVDSPLWTHPDVVITPHVSGPVKTETVAKVFVSNYQKFLRGEPLDYLVDWQRGY